MEWTLIFVGMGVGILSTFFGIGGGVIATPAMYLLFPKIPPQTVISSSLAMIFINSIINNYNFYRLKKVPDYRIFLSMGFTMILGATASGHLSFYINPIMLKKIFAVVLFIVAIKVLFANNPEVDTSSQTYPLPSKSTLFMGMIGSLIGGFIAGATGIGGGIIIIPILLIVLKIPYNWTATYSNSIVIFGSCAAVITYITKSPPENIFTNSFLNYFQTGYVNWGLPIILCIGSLLTSRLGVKLGKKAPYQLTRLLFAALLLLVSGKIFLSF